MVQLRWETSFYFPICISSGTECNLYPLNLQKSPQSSKFEGWCNRDPTVTRQTKHKTGREKNSKFCWPRNGLDHRSVRVFSPELLYIATVFGMSQNYPVILLQKFRTASPSARCFILRHQMQRRKKILDDLCNENGSLRIVIAISALEWG